MDRDNAAVVLSAAERQFLLQLIDSALTEGFWDPDDEPADDESAAAIDGQSMSFEAIEGLRDRLSRAGKSRPRAEAGKGG